MDSMMTTYSYSDETAQNTQAYKSHVFVPIVSSSLSSSHYPYIKIREWKKKWEVVHLFLVEQQMPNLDFCICSAWQYMYLVQFAELLTTLEEESVVTFKGVHYNFCFFPSSSDLHEESLAHCHRIQVARYNVISNKLQLYEDNTILQCKLNVQSKEEVGLGFGGPTRDLFASLWNAAYEEYFEGDTVKIPFCSPHQQIQMKQYFRSLG